MKYLYIFLSLLSVFPFSGCDFLFGTTEDEVANEIFEEGAIDPELIPADVGYVPVLPFWGGFSNPIEVYAGYDEMIYVIDDLGLHVLDQAGNRQDLIAIQGATDIVQDRRLHTYVCGRVDFDADGDGVTENLAAIYHLSGTGTGVVVFEDTLIHPFNDVSRNITSFRGADDIAVQFTGVTTLADNTLYVSRTGPRNDIAGIARPDNAILFYNTEGTNTGYANGLSPTAGNLKSTWNMSGMASFAAPPQSLSGISTSPDVLVCLTAPEAPYKVLWIQQFSDAEAGITYGENAALAAFDLSKADRFLYEPNRFGKPEDVYVAPDFTGYIFVVDSEKDSLFQFTRRGYEGVNPPAGNTTGKQIPASFGGNGDGPFQFNNPAGVCYLRKIVYVADSGNGRISRYILSTDLE